MGCGSSLLQLVVGLRARTACRRASGPGTCLPGAGMAEEGATSLTSEATLVCVGTSVKASAGFSCLTSQSPCEYRVPTPGGRKLA